MTTGGSIDTARLRVKIQSLSPSTGLHPGMLATIAASVVMPDGFTKGFIALFRDAPVPSFVPKRVDDRHGAVPIGWTTSAQYDGLVIDIKVFRRVLGHVDLSLSEGGWQK